MEWLSIILAPILGYFGAVSGVKRELASREKQHQENLQQQLRLAAIDKRLEIHQEAFTHWLRVSRSLHDQEKLQPLLDNAFEWWDQKSLYLGPEIAHKFRVALLNAGTYQQTLIHAQELRDSELIKKTHEEIVSVGKLIQESVGLPAIGDLVEDPPEITENS